MKKLGNQFSINIKKTKIKENFKTIKLFMYHG